MNEAKEKQSLQRNALTVGAAKGAGCHSAYEGQSMSGAQAVVAALECEGVDYIFGYPGAQAIALYDALYDSQVTHILSRHEQAAVHEADGYARSTGKVGVVLVTSGPGATNTVTGIATAYLDSIPLVVITGQVPRAVIGTDAFQESDTMSITMPVVKHSFLAQNASDLPGIVREAFHIAITGRPGPVVIDIPSDVAAEQLEFHYPEQVNIPSYKPMYKCNAKQVKAAVALMEASSRPVILAGGGLISSGAGDLMIQLAERLGAPVCETLMGKGALPNTHKLCLGAIGMHGSPRSNTALMESDLLIALGTRLSDRVTGDIESFAPHAKLIHVDIDPAEIGKVREADVPIVGDLQAVLKGILAQLEKTEHALQTAEWWEFLQSLPDLPAHPSAGASDEISPQHLMQTLAKKLAAGEAAGIPTIVTTEVGQHQMWAAQYLDRQTPRSFLSSGGLGTMGFGFPAAIGAQVGNPDAQVVCIAGDGSFQMNIQEMATAVSAGTPVKVIVLNNSVLGMVHQWQQCFWNERFSQTNLSFNPDFVAVAKAYGWQAAQVKDPGQVSGALDEMLASSGPYLLEVIISAEELVTPMTMPGKSLLSSALS